ncbi:MAG: chemotaxis-specific protein-glutamate methyltransferase CheB [Deltaproteobacteria bacterium]|nr:MAG: chemotaxis-specific protein-glutamate methyltransferase CheB [Deltaproteobacteria bacterium]
MGVSAAQPVRVLVIDDSAHRRQRICERLESFPGVRVVGTACDGEQALRETLTRAPGVIALDLETPRMDGFAFLRRVLEARPTAVVVVRARAADENVFQALELGAVDFVARPASSSALALDSFALELRRTIGALQNLRVETLGRPGPRLAPECPARVRPVATPGHRVVAIGASTGGPSALMRIFGGFSEPPPCAILVSQHMPRGFTRRFADRIARRTTLRAREASGGEALEPGLVLIAPGGSHLELEAVTGRVVTRRVAAAPGDAYAPSIDRMFASAAKHLGPDLLAVVPTGMGDDGCRGAGAVRASGGAVLAESEDSAVIFGMPRQVIRAGHVDAVLHLGAIGNAIAWGLPRPTTRGLAEGVRHA